MVTVKFTADVFDPSSEDTFNGWVDPDYSMWTLFESADTPKEYTFDTEAEALEFIDATIGSVTPGDRGSYYSEDARVNYETGESWTYGAHITQL